MKKTHLADLLASALFLAACGGGGSSATTDLPAAQSTLPGLSSQTLALAQGVRFGADRWPDGDTSTGGNGNPVGAVVCPPNEQYHLHAHLAILLDGAPLAIPAQVGLQGCAYEVHTHDHSGIIHVETSYAHSLTLGDFFAVWGQPLDPSNVAGIVGKPVRVFTVNAGAVAELTDNFGKIPLTAHAQIVIAVGTVPAQLPNFSWPSDL